MKVIRTLIMMMQVQVRREQVGIRINTRLGDLSPVIAVLVPPTLGGAGGEGRSIYAGALWARESGRAGPTTCYNPDNL